MDAAPPAQSAFARLLRLSVLSVAVGVAFGASRRLELSAQRPVRSVFATTQFE
jgi:predicted Kef-type K+ transport protein